MLRISVAALGIAGAMMVSVFVPGGHAKQGAPTQAPAPLPSVTLPAELDRVLRDYEKNWKANNADGLTALFTDDGFINRNGWIRGREAIRQAYAGSGGDLRLRAVGFAAGDTVGYIVGGYRYGDANQDGGKFVLTLRRAPRGDWKIAVDLDATNRN